MYKLLLCRRYLRTRLIALASIISVMLGVATMVVVNAVMTGFSTEMKDRIHGMLADVVIEARSSDGFEDPERLMQLAREAAGDDIAAMTPTVEIYGMLSHDYMGQMFHRPVTLIGIQPQGKDLVSPISDYLMTRSRSIETKLEVPLAQHAEDAALDWSLTDGAMEERRAWIDSVNFRSRAYTGSEIETVQYEQPKGDAPLVQTAAATDSPFFESPDPTQQTALDQTAAAYDIADPFADDAPAAESESGIMPGFDPTALPALDQSEFAPVDPYEPLPARLYVGAGLISYPHKNPVSGDVETVTLLRPGQDATVSTIKTGVPDPIRFQATVVDLFQSGMAEYDQQFVFCNIEQLQIARGMMVRPLPGETADWRRGGITSIQIKLADGASSREVVQRLQEMLFSHSYTGEDGRTRSLYTLLDVSTWEDKQSVLLEAVAMEAAVLNVLLSLIVAVAGFGILAIFFMIVVEKTKDIGTLKALGASARGIMSIFLGYGLSLGLVGAGFGIVLGLLFVWNINTIEDGVSWLSGQEVFSAEVYFFQEIPTVIHPSMVVSVALGAVAIATLASVLPAMRAARMHPVEALRYQ